MQTNVPSATGGHPRLRETSRVPAAGVLFAMATVALVSSSRIGVTGFWLDEVSSVVTALDWDRMWEWLRRYEANMWLYYLLLHFWLMLGHSEAVVRGLSVVAGVATVPAVYGLARRLAGRGAGVVASLLLATNLFFMRYAQEARAYSLLVLLVTASTYFLVREVEEPSPKYWLGFTLCAAAAVYAHFFGILVLVAQIASLAWLPRGHAPWRHLAYSGVSLTLLLAPIVLFQPLNSGQADWLSQPAPSDLWVLLTRLAGSRSLVVLYGVLCAVAIVPIVRHWGAGGKWTMTDWRHLLVLLWLVVPPAVAFLVSVLVKPVWVNRYLVMCVPPLILLGSSGIARLRRLPLQSVAVAVLLLLSGRCLLWLYRASPQEDWRSIARFVMANAGEGEPVLFYAYHLRQPFEYYYYQLEANPSRLRLCELSPEPYRPGGGGRFSDPNGTLLRSIARQYDHPWLVLGYCWNEALGRDVQRRTVEDVLSENHRVALERRFGFVIVRRYERPSAKPPDPPSRGGEDLSSLAR